MKKYIRHTTCFLFFLLIFLAPGTVQASQKAGLTLMVYMCGSNLESGSGAASADLMEMASSGYDVRSMNVLVMTGGTDYWSIGLPTDSLCIYQPGRGSMRMLEAYEGESMGTPGPLAELLNFGYMNYPAEKYALILWDHGGGPLEGVCLDELYDSDTLTMEELCAALAASPAAEEKLEWIGFDACLMGSAEVASLMVPYARYMVASEETEPGTGWNYTVLNGLSADGADAGKQIIDGYFDSAGEDDTQLTLSCTDLSCIETLRAGLDDLFPSLEISSGNYALYSYTAGNTRSFGKSVSGSGGYDLIDLAALIQAFKEQEAEKAQLALDALSSAVVYSRSGSESGGLSVYHPYANQTGYAQEWGEHYPSLGFSSGYAQYITRFAAYLFGDAGVSWKDLSASLTKEEKVYALPLSEPQQSMYSSAVMNLLSWDEKENAYSSVCSVNDLQAKDGILYGVLPDLTLCAADADGSLLFPVPWETLADGTIGVYVNYCKDGALASPEALKMVAVDTGGRRKDFGSYTFDLEDSSSGQSSSSSSSSTAANQPSSSGSSSWGSSAIGDSFTNASSSSLTDLLGNTPSKTESISPLSSDSLKRLEVPSSISMKTSVTPVLSQASSSLFSLFSGSHEAAVIKPVSSESLPSTQVVSSGSVGSSVNVDKLVPVGTERFTPDQVEIRFDQIPAPAGSAEEQPDVIHAWLRCEAAADGSVRVLETWLYEESSRLWSTRQPLDPALYTGSAFPVSWKIPVTREDALTGFSSWTESHTSLAGTAGMEWALRFLAKDAADQGKLCVSFEVTDTQGQTHSSLPLMLE